jgi:hypothetical protein
MFALFVCSSAVFSSPAATASCRRRQRPGHRPRHRNQVRATHSERRRWQRPRHHDQVAATNKERLFGQRPAHHDQVPVTNNVAAGSGLSSGLNTTAKCIRRIASGAADNGLGTTTKYIICSSAGHLAARRGRGGDCGHEHLLCDKPPTRGDGDHEHWLCGVFTWRAPDTRRRRPRALRVCRDPDARRRRTRVCLKSALLVPCFCWLDIRLIRRLNQIRRVVLGGAGWCWAPLLSGELQVAVQRSFVFCSSDGGQM